MKAYKCDCCGHYYTTSLIPLFGRENLQLVGSVSSHDQTEKKDLCEECGKSLQCWWETRRSLQDEST